MERNEAPRLGKRPPMSKKAPEFRQAATIKHMAEFYLGQRVRAVKPNRAGTVITGTVEYILDMRHAIPEDKPGYKRNFALEIRKDNGVMVHGGNAIYWEPA